MIVEDVMNEPYVIEDDINLSEAVALMNENKIGCLIFVSEGKIKGIITERDILKNFNKKNKVSKVMSREVIVIEPDKDLNDAYSLMKENNIKRVPVVSSGNLVGIITATDLLLHADELDELFFF